MYKCLSCTLWRLSSSETVTIVRVSERLPGLHSLHLYWFRTGMTDGLRTQFGPHQDSSCHEADAEIQRLILSRACAAQRCRIHKSATMLAYSLSADEAVFILVRSTTWSSIRANAWDARRSTSCFQP